MASISNGVVLQALYVRVTHGLYDIDCVGRDSETSGKIVAHNGVCRRSKAPPKPPQKTRAAAKDDLPPSYGIEVRFFGSLGDRHFRKWVIAAIKGSLSRSVLSSSPNKTRQLARNRDGLGSNALRNVSEENWMFLAQMKSTEGCPE
jgi:hypothetical protein